MSEVTKIEWCDHTWSPWRGCTKVSPGCTNCYAEALSKRNPAVLGEWGPNGKRAINADWRKPPVAGRGPGGWRPTKDPKGGNIEEWPEDLQVREIHFHPSPRYFVNVLPSSVIPHARIADARSPTGSVVTHGTMSTLKEKPILLRREDVPKILVEGKFRRIQPLKPQPSPGCHEVDDIPCPYGRLGESFWGKETWALVRPWSDPESGYVDWIDEWENPIPGELPTGWRIWYAADSDDIDEHPDDRFVKRWRPSIFMPRWASRILLELVSARPRRTRDQQGRDLWVWVTEFRLIQRPSLELPGDFRSLLGRDAVGLRSPRPSRATCAVTSAGGRSWNLPSE